VKRTPWLSWRLYFLTIPIDVLVLLLSGDHASTGSNDFFNWAILALMAHGLIAPFIALALFFTAKRNSWKSDLLALLILGALRGIAINIGIEILNLEPKVSSIYKIFNSAISLPLWFIGIAIFIESHRQYQREFEALFLRYVRKQQTSIKKQNLDLTQSPEAQPLKHLRLVASDLASEIEGVLNQPTSQDDYAKQTGKIRDLVNNELRPTSFKLWNGSTLSAPKLSISSLVRVSLLEQKLKVISASLFFCPYIFIGLNGTQGWRLAAVEALLATSLNILVFIICEFLYKYNFLTRKSTNIAIMTFSYLLPLVVILSILPGNLFWTASIATTFFYQFFLSTSHVFLLLGFNVYKLLDAQRSIVLQNFQQIIEDKELFPISNDDLTAVRDIDLARYLHGELQAGLIASSLLLERALKMKDTELARHALKSAVDLLSQDHLQLSQSRISTAQARIDKISTGWRGIAEVDVALDWINTLDASLVNDVIALIDEGVSNAIRHGKASVISVSGFRVGSELKIEILSDGTQMIEKAPGLGTKLFTELAASWDFSRDGEQNILKFTVRADPS
jgi:signal transduction histidine kinase